MSQLKNDDTLTNVSNDSVHQRSLPFNDGDEHTSEHTSEGDSSAKEAAIQKNDSAVLMNTYERGYKEKDESEFWSGLGQDGTVQDESSWRIGEKSMLIDSGRPEGNDKVGNDLMSTNTVHKRQTKGDFSLDSDFLDEQNSPNDATNGQADFVEREGKQDSLTDEVNREHFIKTRPSYLNNYCSGENTHEIKADISQKGTNKSITSNVASAIPERDASSVSGPLKDFSRVNIDHHGITNSTPTENSAVAHVTEHNHEGYTELAEKKLPCEATNRTENADINLPWQASAESENKAQQLPWVVSDEPENKEEQLPWEVSDEPQNKEGQLPWEVSDEPENKEEQLPWEVSNEPENKEEQLPWEVSDEPQNKDEQLPWVVSDEPENKDEQLPWEVSDEPQNKEGQLPWEVSDEPENKEEQLPWEVSNEPENKEEQLPWEVSDEPQNKDEQLPWEVSNEAENKEEQLPWEVSDEPENKDEQLPWGLPVSSGESKKSCLSEEGNIYNVLKNPAPEGNVVSEPKVEIMEETTQLPNKHLDLYHACSSSESDSLPIHRVISNPTLNGEMESDILKNDVDSQIIGDASISEQSHPNVDSIKFSTEENLIAKEGRTGLYSSNEMQKGPGPSINHAYVDKSTSVTESAVNNRHEVSKLRNEEVDPKNFHVQDSSILEQNSSPVIPKEENIIHKNGDALDFLNLDDDILEDDITEAQDKMRSKTLPQHQALTNQEGFKFPSGSGNTARHNMNNKIENREHHKISKYAPSLNKDTQGSLQGVNSIQNPQNVFNRSEITSLKSGTSVPEAPSKMIAQKKSFFEELPVVIPKTASQPARSSMVKANSSNLNQSNNPHISPSNPYRQMSSDTTQHQVSIPPKSRQNVPYGLIGQTENLKVPSSQPYLGNVPLQNVNQNPQPFPLMSNPIGATNYGHSRNASLKSPIVNKSSPMKANVPSNTYVPKAGPYAPGNHNRKPSRTNSLIGAKKKEINPYAPVQNAINTQAPVQHGMAMSPSHITQNIGNVTQLPVSSSPNTLAAQSTYTRNRGKSGSKGNHHGQTTKVHDENLLRQRQYPIFSWSSTSKVSYLIPANSFQSYETQSSSVQIIEARNIFYDHEIFSSFPGPLTKPKSKSKELLKWLETIEKRLESEPMKQDEYLINRIFTSILNHNYDLASKEFIKAICMELNPSIDYRESPSSSEQAYSINVVPNAYKLDSNGINIVYSDLQLGQIDKALEFTMLKGDWALSLILAMGKGKDVFKRVVAEYARSTYPFQKTNNKMIHMMPILLKSFAGSFEDAISDFQNVQSEKDWALHHWREILASIIINHNDKVGPFLMEFSKFLSANGLVLASQICSMLIGGSSTATKSMNQNLPIIGLNNPSFFYSELYEYCLYSYDIGVPNTAALHLLPIKLRHAQLLADYGLFAESQKYCDYIGTIIKNIPKGTGLSSLILKEFQNLVIRVSDANMNEQSWFGGKLSMVNLDKMWGHLDKLIGGDEVDPKGVQNGVFSKFSPSISRTSSSVGFTPVRDVTQNVNIRSELPESNDLNNVLAPSQEPHINIGVSQIPVQSRSTHTDGAIIPSRSPRMKKLSSSASISKYAPHNHEVYKQNAGKYKEKENLDLGYKISSPMHFNKLEFLEKNEEYMQNQEVATHKTSLPNDSAYFFDRVNHKVEGETPRTNGDSLGILYSEPTSEDALNQIEKSNIPAQLDNLSAVPAEKDSQVDHIVGNDIVAPNMSNNDTFGTPDIQANSKEMVKPPPRRQQSKVNVYAPGGSGTHNSRKKVPNTTKISKYSNPNTASPLHEETTTGIYGSGYQDYFNKDSTFKKDAVTQANVTKAEYSSADDAHIIANQKDSTKDVAPTSASFSSPLQTYQPATATIALFEEPTFDHSAPITESALNSFPNTPKKSKKDSMFHPYNPNSSFEKENEKEKEKEKEKERPSNFGFNSSFGEFSIPGSPEGTTRANSVLGGTGGLFSSRLSQSQQSALYQQYEVQDDSVKDYVPILEEDEDSEEEKNEAKRVRERKEKGAKSNTSEEQHKELKSGSSRWFSWLGNKNDEDKPVRANLGQESKFVYDEKLKRYIRTDIPIEEQIVAATPPPPPTIRKKEFSSLATPKADSETAESAPKPLNVPVPSGPIQTENHSFKNKKNLANASLDDLLNLSGGSQGAPSISTRRTKRGTRRGYVNVLDQN